MRFPGLGQVRKGIITGKQTEECLKKGRGGKSLVRCNGGWGSYEQLRKKKRRSRTVTRYRRLLKRFGIVLKGNFNVDFFVSLNLSIQFVLTHRSNPFSAKILLQAPSTDPLNNGYMR
ncbi:hypothetical protein ACN42_g4902 [Penicillium freii]|uniref:Uncharacterized protein n=1 Tax=Penicillium freii TaxID=48697 RepID=A0A117NPB8_PENFR|nr:hypothetical protein ACN42_g4902 [Penicillium freii]